MELSGLLSGVLGPIQQSLGSGHHNGSGHGVAGT
jgi:hypothetical protein